MYSLLCKVCLGWNSDIRLARGTRLYSFFETITNLRIEDGFVESLCNLCYWQLKKCFTFAAVAANSDKTLRELHNRGTMITQESSHTLNIHTPIQNLILQELPLISIQSDMDENFHGTIIKQELTSGIKTENNIYDNDIDSVPVIDELECIKLERKSESKSSKSKKKKTLKIGHRHIFACDICQKSFIKKNNLEKHIINHNFIYQASSQKRLKLYEEISHHIEEIDANIYKETAGSKTIMKQGNGQIKNTQEIEYPCNQCTKIFKNNTNLRNHLKTHTSVKLFTCEKCLKSFSLQIYLQRHMQTHSDVKAFSCNQCDRSFAVKNSLIKHIKTHTVKTYTHTCDRCAKVFTNNADLKRHMLVHTGEKPFVCPDCGKAFARKFQLSEHSRVHTGERPFACTECNKTFTQGSSLSLHKRSHTGQRPFSCEVCSKTFSNKYTLQKHLRIHTGERPYACETCSQTFTYNSSLHDHIRRFHNGVKLTCNCCYKSFSRNSHLKRHLKIHVREKQFMSL